MPTIAERSGPAQARSRASSVPPPIPSIPPGERRKRTTLVSIPSRPEQPSVVDRAIARLAQLDDAARADQLARDTEALAPSDPPAAALLAHELGERLERRRDDDRAYAAYLRALELDPGLRPAIWALRRLLQRRARWLDLVKLIDGELARAPSDRERVELLVDRAIALGHGGDANDQARIALTAAVQLAPRHQGALLELERVVARAGDTAGLLDVWERLAGATDHPARRGVYWLALARSAAARDHERARDALDAAAEFAAAAQSQPLAERIARERLRLADAHGTPAQIGHAIEALIAQLAAAAERAAARRGELVALHRRQAQLVRFSAPAAAWDHLQRALAIDADEPVVLIDLIELAGGLGRHVELPALLDRWQAVETDAGRCAMLSLWCAEAHTAAERREPARALLRSIEAAAPGFALVTSAAECDALGDLTRVRAHLDLAHTYLASAAAAAAGTWLGTLAEPRPDPDAAAALYLQAAQLLASSVATPAALELARDALGKADAAAPDHPAVLEAMTELDDTADRAEHAVARLRARAAAGGGRAALERAMRVAYRHELHHAVVDVARDLVAAAPGELALAWRLEGLLPQRGRDDERAALLDRLARDDRDPARRRTAVFRAARLHERAGDAAAAADRHRQLLAMWPDDAVTRDASAGGAAPGTAVIRDAFIDQLRGQQRWAELVNERRAEARAASDPAAVRCALREAAWVLEVCLDDAAHAAAVYDDWLARLPDDRTALDGAARCRGVLGEHDREAAARARIAALDPSPDAAWLHARSLERAGRRGEAAAHYRGVIDHASGHDGESVAATAAALALGDLAARGGDVAMALEAADALARRTSDPRLGAALHDTAGWLYLLAVDDTARAAQALSAALELDPGRRGALLGAALVASRRSEPMRQGEAYAELAATVAMPEAAAALLLRAAAIAAAGGDLELAGRRVEAARATSPADDHALLVAAETEPPPLADTSDPFAAIDRLLERAELLDQRGALAGDPVSRAAWQLERAEALERAGQASEAAAIVAAVLRDHRDDRRAISALRRIAERADDRRTWAEASYALARLSRDPGTKLQLLRDAVEVYDRSGPLQQLDHATAIYRRILATDPGAPELDRLCEILRERGGVRKLISTLTERLAWLAGQGGDDDEPMIALLLERSALLYSLGRHDKATADLDAILDHAPRHGEALRLRGDLAMLAGETDRAATLWWAYLEVETAPQRRAEIELRLAQAVGTGVVPPPAPSPPAPRAAPRSRAARPTPPAPPPAAAPRAITTTGEDTAEIRIDDDTGVRVRPTPDPFGSTTVETDISALQEHEQEVARTGPQPPRPPTAAAFEREDTVEARHRKLRPPALDLPELFRTTAAAHEAVADGAELEPGFDPSAIQLPEDPQLSPDDSDVVMLPYEQLQPARSDADAVDQLLGYEREIAAHDGAAGLAALRIEAGRLSETLGDAERARGHYDAALAADRGATAALRGLRRLARAQADVAEMSRLVAAELAVAGPRERDALLRYRIDLLMATGEQDLARVAIGEVLDAAPRDLPALLAQLELALLDDPPDGGPIVFGRALEALAGAVTDPALRAALQSARSALASHQGDATAAASWAAAAAETDPAAAAVRLAAIHRAAAGDQRAAGAAYLDLACHLEADDPVTAAALALRAQGWAGGPRDPDRETLEEAAQLATRAAPRDPLVARIAADTALIAGERAVTGHAFARWARCAHSPVERAYAAARAAELEPGKLGRLWAQVLEHDPGDDYAAARLRASYVAAGDIAHAVEHDLARAKATGRDAPVLRAAAELIGDDQFDTATELLTGARAERQASGATSEAIGEALSEALAEAGRWRDRAVLLSELAAEPGALARDVARLRAALAWERAARAAAGDPDAARDEVRRVALAAIAAWDAVLEAEPGDAIGHAARLALASRLGDADILIDALARAQAAERAPWPAASLALRRAQLVAAGDPVLAEQIARDAGPGLDDPRRTLIAMLAAARRGDLHGAATALDDRAGLLEVLAAARRSDATEDTSPGEPMPSLEPAVLRLRAAQLALDADDPVRALALLDRVAHVLPAAVDDLRDAARRRTGAPPADAPPPARSFVRALRDAEHAARDRGAAGLALYQRALEIRPGAPLAAAPLVRIATALRDPQPIAALALEQLRTAESMADPAAKAEAYELLARAEELRGDAAAAQIALEAAVQADPSRIDLLHRLERELAVRRRHAELLRLRERQIDQLAPRGPGAERVAPDLAALIMDAAVLAVRAGAAEPVVARLYRAAFDADSDHPRAGLQLEALARRATPSDDLAALCEHLAAASDDPATRAAFLVRAGDALAHVGKPAEAVKRYARAVHTVPGHLPALDAWHHTALGHKLWRELAEAVARRAALGGDPAAVAALHHFAGVALMDKAHTAEPAIAALRRALELEPGHVDSFVRLRILFDHTGNRDGLAQLFTKRLEIEPDRAAQVELHRLLAEHGCAIGDRDHAMQHYRAVLRLDPADVRAHAAIADLASEHAGWQDAVSAVMARVPLERDPSTLRTLHYRLGALYADHDIPSALSAFQRALTFKPGDKDALTRISELAMLAGKWQLALDACNRLVTTERDPEKLAVHLHRAAAIFDRGFTDRKRAERMLELAFDSAPTSTEGLRLLVKFYQDADDPAGLRAQLQRITGAMRARIAADAKDGPAYRILARAVAVRSEHIVDSSLRIARAAAEIAQLLGAGGELEQRLIAARPTGDAARLLGARGDEPWFGNAVQPEARQVFRVVAPQLAKYLGVDLGVHGFTRRDRLASGDPVTAIAREVAISVGYKDVEVYVSNRDPYAMLAEPTSPVSIVLGQAIVGAGEASVRFAAAAVLKLAHLALAIPARLPVHELGVLGFALLRLVRPELMSPDVPLDEVNAQMPGLRKLISSSLLDELRAHARGIVRFSPEGLARDLRIAGLRAGLAAAGSVLPGLAALAGAAGAEPRSMIGDPIAQGLIGFALNEARATTAP